MHRTAYLLLVLTTLFWGGNAIAGKLAIGHISPMLLTAVRWGAAFVILWLVGRKHLRSDWQAIRQKLPLLAMLGAIGFAGFNIALYSALIYTTAINVSIEQAAMPMLIFAANFVLFKLRVTWLQIVGFVLSIVGVVLTATHGEPLEILALNVNMGDLIMLIAVVVYSAYTVALRLKPAIHWQSLMIMLTGFAFVAAIPFVVAEFYLGAGILPDAQGWAVVGYTIFFPSILAQAFYIRGVDLIGANRAGLFINLVPIFGTLLSVLILRETFHLYHGIAMILVLGGIWLAETSGRRADAEASLPVR